MLAGIVRRAYFEEVEKTMKRLTALPLAAGILLAVTGAPAQTSAPVSNVKADEAVAKITDAQIDLMRKDIRDMRKQIVAANMTLTGDEAAKFWPIYDAYIQETIKVNNVRYSLVKEYAANYTTITDAQASDYIRRWSGVDEAQVKLRLQWVGKFEEAIGSKKAAVFAQIDRRLGLMIDLQLSSQLPLIQP
jgi:hypothetical protein